MVQDWHAIRPLNRSINNGFEELCVQLARAENPPDAQFFRKGTPDGGVECYTVFPDGSEWGWQAKFFDKLEEPQLKQIDRSVETALEKHPRLVRYFVCVPLDRPDARIQRQKSAMERWNARVEKWNKWASDLGMKVEFTYWGSSELLEMLTRPEHIGRRKFWFDIQGFDHPWFVARLEESLRSAGPRYTPEIHVELPIADDFEAFGRTNRFFNQTKAHARDIREGLRSFNYSAINPIEPAVDSLTSDLTSQVQAILTEIQAIKVDPVGDLPFREIADHIAFAGVTAEELEPVLLKHQQEYDAKHPKDATPTQSDKINPFRGWHHDLIRLSSTLREMCEVFRHAKEIAGQNVMILKGDAGTGKTHLLCDVAQQRIKNGQPTVLLMGQRFVSTNDPWAQALQQLDLADLSTEEFVGALEAAAQVADCRALVMVDAINEGKGRDIWPSNLAAFVARLERSPWIGVVFAVRSSYEEIVVPEYVRTQAATVIHEGFAGHEYDATRTFFLHYGIELPSTPLLALEFHNPLYLKTLCDGLHKSGMHRLPRGINGITATFGLYIDAINKKLIEELCFNPKKHLVRRAMGAFAKAMAESGDNWLPLEKAEEIVNVFLPGREYERSLYRGLVSEGVLVENIKWSSDTKWEDMVFIAYERLADHLTAKVLLDIHLDAADPAAAFAEGGPLAFLYDKSRYVAGLLEAMCIQVPERIGKELVTLVPEIANNWYIGRAFRQSLVWRNSAAFSEDTLTVLNHLIRTNGDLDETLDVLLTVAALPDHPYNADFLDRCLRKGHMPERDAWWSIYLHHTWGRKDAVDRLVDWASSIQPSTSIEEEVVDLCAIALSWMFTTSNRFLRDRATKALVDLLTGRMDAVVRLVERFDDVNDPYVTERVYAVAYGVAMRSYDSKGVGALAQCVYNHVFTSSTPPAQILLRDYARGVVERALYLQADLDIVEECIHPPYNSEWPTIPTEEDITPLMPDWSRGSHDSGDLEWARNRIGSSVMDDDFARYVIGTNSSPISMYWLSLRLEDPPWQSPDERFAVLQEEFSAEEKAAWGDFQASESASKQIRLIVTLIDVLGESQDEDSDPDNKQMSTEEEELEEDIENAIKKRDEALTTFRSVVSSEHAPLVEEILPALANCDERHPPGFDLRSIQRYILWRVFDLGWTTKRFGKFDRYSIGFHGRDASKAERIGKKYQWIAYHEILAYVADHFQYQDCLGRNDDCLFYEGPWQNHLRDIDPSCTLSGSCGGTSWYGHSSGWWESLRYENWEEPSDSKEWVLRDDDLPKVEDLFVVSNPKDGTRWLNVQSLFIWRQPVPPDQEMGDTDMREISYNCTSYLVHAEDADTFMEWARNVNFWGRWMPEPLEIYEMFLGEHGWSPASRYFREQYYRERGEEGWAQPSHDCQVEVKPITLKYYSRSSSFDCSTDEGYSLQLPTREIVEGLDLRWSGNAGDYLDCSGRLAAYDPTAKAEGPDAFLIREDILKEYLARENLTLCWVVIGEKRVIEAGFNPNHDTNLISGAYVLGDTEPVGFLHCEPEEAYQNNDENQSDPRCQ